MEFYMNKQFHDTQAPHTSFMNAILMNEYERVSPSSLMNEKMLARV